MIDELRNAINILNKPRCHGRPLIMHASSEKHRQYIHAATGYPLDKIKVVAKLPLDDGKPPA